MGDGGVFAQLPGGFMVELWFRLDQNPPTGSQLFSENLSGTGGPVIFLQFLNEGLRFDHISQNFTTAADMPVAEAPAGGWDLGKWYYAAGVMAPCVEKKLWVYLSDGGSLFRSDSRFRDDGFTNPFPTCDLDRLRLSGSYLRGSGNWALDDFTLYDQPFDPNSYLVQGLGIPEPSSLAVLGLAALLLTKHRHRI